MKTLLTSLLTVFSAVAFGQSSPRFTLTRVVAAGGGATVSSSARFQLASTVGQPIGSAPSSARFSVRNGFWIWPAPVIFAPAKVGTNFLVSLQTELGKNYTVQYANTLGTTWVNLTNVAGNGGVITVTNPASVPQRLYRLAEN